eukprot:TRINITY_DN92176_c0_g1_i1.p1 TRINITY_DN92176_c0_g1~~TRINITY_DN92176_c0_g1_i1.p1  ORF type:complete len:353 (+),score=70.92 TRINITY_DN92176_c0_g1_i1:113-1171(+)
MSGRLPSTDVRDSDGTAQTITDEILQDSMCKAAAAVGTWVNEDYIMKSLLQKAIRNHGQVDLMQRKDGGGHFAVKKMPNKWVRQGPPDFDKTYPTASEKPWVDIGLVRHLNSIKYPYVCELLGVYKDDQQTYVCTSLANKGDLFSWCEKDPKPGMLREAVMIPLAIQMFSGVRMLHELGIAHRDLSLENLLLHEPEGGTPTIKLIDFGMSTTSRMCRKEVRGKQSYQAPELHLSAPYDAFLSDSFALGVVLFAMAVQDYPWTSTVPGQCQLFEYITAFGFGKFLKKRKLRKGKGEHLAEVLSPELAELLKGLLQMSPENRLHLGENCFEPSKNSSAWERSWIQPLAGSPLRV